MMPSTTAGRLKMPRARVLAMLGKVMGHTPFHRAGDEPDGAARGETR
jgi:hypothetical protein